MQFVLRSSLSQALRFCSVLNTSAVLATHLTHLTHTRWEDLISSAGLKDAWAEHLPHFNSMTCMKYHEKYHMKYHARKKENLKNWP